MMIETKQQKYCNQITDLIKNFCNDKNKKSKRAGVGMPPSMNWFLSFPLWLFTLTFEL